MTRTRSWVPRTALSGLCALALAAIPTLSATAVQSESIVTDEEPSLSVSVVRLSPDYLTDEDTLTVEVAVENTGSSSAAGLSVSLAMTTEPLADRTLLEPWERGELDRDTDLIAQASLGGTSGILVGNTAFANLSVSSGLLHLPEEETAVYGLVISVDGPTGRLTDIRTFVTWLDGEPNVTPISILVLGSGSTERVDALIDTITLDEVAFAIDPVVLSPVALVQLVNFDTYLLPAHNIDVDSLSRSVGSDVLDRALSQARSVAPLSLAALPWLAVAADIDQPVVTMASDHGAAGVLSLPTFSTTTPSLSGYEGGVSPGIAVVYTDGKIVPILIPDSSLSTALVAGPPGSATSPAKVTAETALLSESNPAGTPVLAVLGPSWRIESSHQSSTLAALADSPWVELTKISTVLDSPRASIDLPPSIASETDIPIALLASAESSLRSLDSLAQSTPDPTAFSENLADRVLSALSFDWRTDATGRNEALEQAIAAIDEVRSAVSLPGSNTLNLISKSGNVPVTVTNNLDVDLTARVVLECRSPILQIVDNPEVTLAAGSSTQVLVPVTAISNGNVVVDVSVENLDGNRLTPISRYSLRIRAAWGDLFTIIIAGLGLLLLVMGTIRTVKRGRADTRLGPSVEPLNGAS